MRVAIGDQLPQAKLAKMGAAGVELLDLSSLSQGKRLVLFGLPGAFTRTCSGSHLPSFIHTAADFKAKGIDHVICISVNDAMVMQAWDKSQGAGEAGVELLADMNGAFTKAMGMDFDAPALGFFGRSLRYSALIEDGIIKILNMESQAGAFEATSGETLLAQI